MENLTVVSRTVSGKNAVHRLRVSGKTPATFYGYDVESATIQIDTKELRDIIDNHSISTTIFKLQCNDNAEINDTTALIREVQMDYLSRYFLHVDLCKINTNKEMVVDIPVIAHGKPIGVDMGGIISQVRHTLKIRCLPLDIPKNIKIDIHHLNLGESILIKDLPLPENVKSIQPGHIRVLSIVLPGRAAKLKKGDVEAETKDDVTEAVADA